MSKHVAIIGAGIAGLNIAYQLHVRGISVSVFERETSEALQCSYANGGQISVCNAATWHTWDNVVKGLRWMMQKDAPFYSKPSLSISKLAWIAGFLKNTVKGKHEELTKRTIALGLHSSAVYDQIVMREGLHFEQQHSGMLHVYTNEKSLEDALKYRDMFQDNGVSWIHVSPDEIKKHDPNMAHFKNMVGGVLTPEDWTGDIKQYCQQLRDILQKRGVKFVFNAQIDEVKPGAIFFKRDSDEMEIVADDDTLPVVQFKHSRRIESGYDAIVISAGYEIDKFAGQCGEWLNVYPVKGYSVTIEDAFRAPKVSLLDDDKKIVSAKFDDSNRFRIAGTAELDGDNRDIKRARIEPLLRWCQENFDVDIRNYSSWCCHRPMAADMMPIFRRSKTPGIYYHGAHGHLGWTLSAGTANILAADIERDLL